MTLALKGHSFVTRALKEREIYHHLSNASDRLAHTGKSSHDIVWKTA